MAAFVVAALVPLGGVAAGASLAGTVEVMPLGDSITEGVLGSSNDTGYRRDLWLSQVAAGHSLDFVGSRSTGIPSNFDKDHEGHPGMRADQIRDGVAGWLTAHPADVVLLHIGTNDITQGQSAASTAAEIGQILDTISANDDTTWVIVAQIVPRGDGNAVLTQRTNDLNGRIATLVGSRSAGGDRVALVDMNSPLNPATDLDDGIHPDDSGYAKMATAWDAALGLLLGGDTTRPVITLVGPNPQTVELGGVYVERGATAFDNVDGDLSDEVVVDASAVKVGTVGTYQVTYNVVDAAGNAAVEKVRTVKVVDTTPPVITLVGPNPQTVELGGVYVERGATAFDNVDGDLSDEVVVDASAVKVGTVGTYQVTYNVVDAAGNAGVEKVRTVKVVDTTPPVIALVGANPLTVVVGSTYVEPGAVVADNQTAPIAPVINATGVNTRVPGTYQVIYNAADASGNSAKPVSRLVSVVPVPPSEDPAAALVGLFSSDDRDDLAVWKRQADGWWVGVSNGSRFFVTPWSSGMQSGVTVLRVGDFDGDVLEDIAAFAGGTWWVRRSTGISFSAAPWAGFATSSGWSSQVVGDFDGDGRDDIANFHPSNGTWWVSRSSGSGFVTSLWADFATSSGWSSQVVGDFDGDGRDDIANFHPSNGTWWVSRSSGSGFVTSLWADFATSSGWSSQVVGDFDGDGRDDIANFHPSNGTWWVSRSSGSGFVTSLWADFATSSGWSSQVVGDFDGDGRDDIANFHPSHGAWMVSRSSGSRFTTTAWATFSDPAGWSHQLVGDVDGDGRHDIVNYHARTGAWWVAVSTGSAFATSRWD